MEVDERVNICSMIFSNQLIRFFPSKASIMNAWSTDESLNIPGVDSAKTSYLKDRSRDGNVLGLATAAAAGSRC